MFFDLVIVQSDSLNLNTYVIRERVDAVLIVTRHVDAGRVVVTKVYYLRDEPFIDFTLQPLTCTPRF